MNSLRSPPQLAFGNQRVELPRDLINGVLQSNLRPDSMRSRRSAVVNAYDEPEDHAALGLLAVRDRLAELRYSPSSGFRSIACGGRVRRSDFRDGTLRRHVCTPIRFCPGIKTPTVLSLVTGNFVQNTLRPVIVNR